MSDEHINYVAEQQKNRGELSLVLSPNRFSLSKSPAFSGSHMPVLDSQVFLRGKTVVGVPAVELGTSSFVWCHFHS